MIYSSLTAIFLTVSVVAVILLCFFYCRCALPERGTVEWIHIAVRRPCFKDGFSRGKITSSDVQLILYACVIYAVLSAAALLFWGIADPDSAGGVLTFGSAQPLWKVISDGLTGIFGTFGYTRKVPGVVFGILTVALSGVFIKMLSKSTLGTFLSLLMLVCSGVFLTVCGTDSHAALEVLLIIAAFFTMYLYITADEETTVMKTLVPMLLCGLISGAGCAVSPQMALSLPGLAAVLVFTLFVRGAPGARVSGGAKTVMIIGSFILLPAAAYAAACILCGADFPQDFTRFLTAPDAQGALLVRRGFIGLTPDVYLDAAPGGRTVTVSALINPLVCLGGFAAMIILIQRALKHRDSSAVIILLAFLTTALPAVLVRGTAADSLPGSVFAVYALSVVFAVLLERKRRGSTAYAVIFAMLIILVFALLLPVLAGIPVDADYFRTHLAWLPCWQF